MCAPSTGPQTRVLAHREGLPNGRHRVCPAPCRPQCLGPTPAWAVWGRAPVSETPQPCAKEDGGVSL